MRNKLPLMKLSLEEEIFLRHWMYDEWHYEAGQGPAKRLQVEHKVVPADIATLIAAAMPDLSEQIQAALGPPPAEPPIWPWTDDACARRVEEARELLGAPKPRNKMVTS
jgi:hypothetical protein